MHADLKYLPPGSDGMGPIHTVKDAHIGQDQGKASDKYDKNPWNVANVRAWAPDRIKQVNACEVCYLESRGA